ncbi:MAG: beta-propeller domain-containing protein [Candidatus Izemoplasmatales bacterium]
MKKIIMMFFIMFSAIFFISCQNRIVDVPSGENVGSFASYDQLSDYLKTFYHRDDYRYFISDSIAEDSLDVGAVQNEIDFSKNQEREHSTVNNQVDGVEESDSIMTDGFYVYITSGNKFFMIDAESLDVVYTYELLDGYLDGLYIYEDKIVLIGGYYNYYYLDEEEIDSSSDSEYYYPDYYYHRYQYGTKIIVLDMSNIEDIEVSRELIFDSSYLSNSRMIDGHLYLILNNYSISDYYEEDYFVPKYLDSVKSSEMMKLPAGNIFFMPNDNQSFSYLILASFAVDETKEADIKAYLGSTYQIYMSGNNLYATVYKYAYDEMSSIYQSKTFILRFEIEDNSLVYKAMGEIKGMPLNQFSMDEYDGVFRVAVTDYLYTNEETIITNTLYLMDASTENKMEEISSLTGLGKPGERIYAVRFSKEIAYVVTFVSVDPLYKLDLSNPEEPIILGEHYEEGVSDYLHPLTDNLMIGVGRQAVKSDEGWTNFVGVKIALYETSEDIPVNLETYLVEGEYSYTNVTYNHKSFISFSPKEADFTYIAIPISIYFNNYSRYSQKLFVFKVFHTGDLELVAELEHFEEGNSYFDSIEKAVIIENYIYTLSYSQVQVYDMNNDFSFLDKVVINQMYYETNDYTENPIETDFAD